MANEMDVQKVIRWALERQGYWTRHIPKNQRIGTQKGAPDLLAFHPKLGANCQIEVKAMRPNYVSFPMSEIDEEQRKYLNNIISDGGDAYFGFGVIRWLGENKKKSKVTDAYIIPWEFWVRIEEYYQALEQPAIPFDWDLYDRKPQYWGKFLSLKEVLEDSHECPLIETKIQKTDGYPALPEHSKIRLGIPDVMPFHVRLKEEHGIEKSYENRYSSIE